MLRGWLDTSLYLQRELEHRFEIWPVFDWHGVPGGVHVGFEALCADPDVDLVDVVTRPSRHRAMASAALAAGKHALVEVPLAATTADGFLRTHPALPLPDGVPGGMDGFFAARFRRV